MEGFAWVAAGGAIGAAARYGVNLWGARYLSPVLPWSTLIVNVLGCFTMGLLVSLAIRRPDMSPGLRLFLTTGILGGFTTFSAFAADFAGLVRVGEVGNAIAYLLASVTLSLVAVFAGLALGRTAF